MLRRLLIPCLLLASVVAVPAWAQTAPAKPKPPAPAAKPAAKPAPKPEPKPATPVSPPAAPATPTPPVAPAAPATPDSSTSNPAVKGAPGRIDFTSTPPGASVVQANAVIGKTPCSLDSVLPGETLHFEARLEGYAPRKASIILDPGESVVVDFGKLEASMGALTVQVTLDGRAPDAAQLNDLRFNVDGEVRDHVVSHAISAMTHTVSVSHPDYETRAQNVPVSEGKETLCSINLLPKPARVSATIEAPDARWRLQADGREVPADAQGAYLVPAGRPVELRVTHPDCPPVTETVVFQPNRPASWKARMIPYPPPSDGAAYAIPGCQFLKLAWIPAGKSLIGSPLKEHRRLPEEGPSTLAHFSKGFWMGRHEVSRGEYLAITGKSPSKTKANPEYPDMPVDYVSWDEANAFCSKLTELEAAAKRLPQGYAYRLPTEMEWEYCARAGTRKPFSWGDTADPSRGNFMGVYPMGFEAPPCKPKDSVARAGEYAPNAWGLHDMHGNVREWCLDGWRDRLPGKEVRDWYFHNGEDVPRRVWRGGAYDDPAFACRSSARDSSSTESRSKLIGFRIVLAPQSNPGWPVKDEPGVSAE